MLKKRNNNWLDGITPIERVCFTKLDRFFFTVRKWFGFKNTYTWREIILMAEDCKDKDTTYKDTTYKEDIPT